MCVKLLKNLKKISENYKEINYALHGVKMNDKRGKKEMEKRTIIFKSYLV